MPANSSVAKRHGVGNTQRSLRVLDGLADLVPVWFSSAMICGLTNMAEPPSAAKVSR